MKTREEILLTTKGAELIKIADKLGVKVACNKERTQLKEAKGNVIKRILEAEKVLEEKAKKEKKATKKASKKSESKREVAQYTYGGKTQGLTEWSEELGISRKTLYRRLHKYGWTTEKAFEKEVNSEVTMYEFNGKKQGLTEWSKELGISRKTLYRRINRYGWDIEKAFTTIPNENK